MTIPWGRLAAILGVLAGAFALGWITQGWRAGEEIAVLKAHQAQEMKAISDTATKAAGEAQALQARMTTANAKIDELQGDIAREKATSDRLRADVALGRSVVRIAAACPAGGGRLPQATAPASVDAAAPLELPASVGVNLLDLKSGIVEDQRKIEALQRYATDVCQAQ